MLYLCTGAYSPLPRLSIKNEWCIEMKETFLCELKTKKWYYSQARHIKAFQK